MTPILVTRPAAGEDPLVIELRRLGLDVIAVPTVLTRSLDVRWPDLSSFDWVVVTSAAGAATLPPIPRGVSVAAVGRATAAALEERGIAVALIPAQSSGQGIADELDVTSGTRVLLARASAAAPDLPNALRGRAAAVEEIVAYETVEGPEESRTALQEALSHGVAAVVFASGSAARGYVALGGERSVPAVTIGPRTSAVAQELGFKVAAEAHAADTKSLAAAVESVVRDRAARHA